MSHPALTTLFEREATRNLIHRLAYAGQLSIREQELVPMLRHDSYWLKKFTHLFASHLLDESQLGARHLFR